MRVFVDAYGCSQNQGEAHALSRAIHDAGHSLVAGPEAADAGVLVTCGVIGSTEARMVRRWQELSRRVPRVVVTGCLVPLRTGLFVGPGLERTRFLPIRSQSELPTILDGWSGSSDRNPAAPTEPLPATPGPAVAEVVLAQGCTSHCTYCYSRLARGRLESRSKDRIVEEVRGFVAAGAAEVRLTSLDTSCWGSDGAGPERLPELLDALAGVPGTFRLRVGMMSPQSLGPIAERLWPAMAEGPVYRFLHLPMQSGSDRVLHAMRRGYDAAAVRSRVAEARRAMPDLMLSTDVIVGFPGETEAEFSETLELVDELSPEVVNVTRFSPRPMTPAALLPPLPTGTVKRRSRAVSARRMAVARARLERWIGREEPAGIVEAGSSGESVARLDNYLPVVLPEPFRGPRRVQVRIDGARSCCLLGRRVPN